MQENVQVWHGIFQNIVILNNSTMIQSYHISRSQQIMHQHQNVKSKMRTISKTANYISFKLMTRCANATDTAITTGIVRRKLGTLLRRQHTSTYAYMRSQKKSFHIASLCG